MVTILMNQNSILHIYVCIVHYENYKNKIIPTYRVIGKHVPIGRLRNFIL